MTYEIPVVVDIQRPLNTPTYVDIFTKIEDVKAKLTIQVLQGQFVPRETPP